MMPVTVESSAASPCSAGSSSRASAPLSHRRPRTPLAVARAAIDFRLSTWAGVAATTSLPQRRWPTPRDSQYGKRASRPATQSVALSEPGAS